MPLSSVYFNFCFLLRILVRSFPTIFSGIFFRYFFQVLFKFFSGIFQLLFKCFSGFFRYFSAIFRFLLLVFLRLFFSDIFQVFFLIFSGFSGIFANIFRHFPRCVAGIILHIFSGTFSGGAFGFRVQDSNLLGFCVCLTFLLICFFRFQVQTGYCIAWRQL